MNSFWKHLFIDNGDITIIEAGHQKYVANQTNNYKVRHDLILHIVLEGKGSYAVNDHTYELGPRDAFLLKKNATVHYGTNDEQPWTIAWLGLGGVNLTNYLQHTLLNTRDILSFKDNSDVWHELTSFIHLLSYSDPRYYLDYLAIFSKAYQLLLSFNQEFPDKQLAKQPYLLPEPNLAEKIYAYIFENFLDNLSIRQISEHFDISRNYLFKLCKEYYGQSPKSMIQELRMNQAGQLLRGSKMQIKEIANMVGYKDAFSFSKMFTQYHQLSPSEFRKLSEADYAVLLAIMDENLHKRSLKRYY